MREAAIELQRLDDRRHRVAFDLHELPHATGVDRARPHPLVDRHLVVGVEALGREEELRHQRPME
jgi:hypothetical protein